jgi:hypothetical protein
MQGRPGRTIWQLALVCVIFFSISHAARGQAESPQPLSFLELIANPNKFDGKLIFVTAFLGLDRPDGNMLYLHTEDYDNGILLNAVSIETTKQMWIDSEKLDGSYVTVVGVFESAEKARSRFSGINEVRSCAFLSQPSNPIRGKLRRLHKHEPKPQNHDGR